ncbi:hypothetical protein H4S07_000897 [Coemansia furcata]|uniref:Uncharacterized protein n=1 Tax=Coemansia furcata TaxID=417177 RepID=A0ACC1LPU9_9FUNG|nr:hypothetical protein H4S07_000897 [Coemansia furcata]
MSASLEATAGTSSPDVGGLRSGLSNLDSLALGETHADDRGNDSRRIAHIDEMRDWLSGGPLRWENTLYNPIKAFVSYVARCVEAERERSINRDAIRRRILPAETVDYNPYGADDTTRIDIGLCGVTFDESPTTISKRAPYHRLLAVVEAKVHSSDSDKAFPQLYGYIRQMFQTQHNLRFAWGFTICGNEIRVCHFGSDKAVSSKPMDITTSSGRLSFIELLVNWSVCEEHQLGRDPTIGYLPDLGCWQIDCPNDGARGFDTKPRCYYFNTVVCHADRLFGRHTRCFLATDIKPMAKVTDTSPLVPAVVIKDAWAFAERLAHEDVRNEIKLLNKIKTTLSERITPEDDIIYPEIVVGGQVLFTRNGGKTHDNTDSMYRGVEFASDMKPHFRVHRRIVMAQIGKRLHTLNSVDEFITVVGDVMRCHNAIFQHCKILHRDISDNNVLVFRQADGIARGLLIDFDCALDTSLERLEAQRPEMTGTLPFMSINNLSELSVTRTVLDDHESMLYLVCWLATLGIGDSERRESKDLEKLPIARWRNGPADSIVWAKKAHFGTENSLLTNITMHFSGKKSSSDDKANDTNDNDTDGDDPDKAWLTDFARWGTKTPN